MYPGRWGRESPERAALIMGSTGEVVTHAMLDERTNRLAQLLYARGLRPRDHVALFMENHVRFQDVVWAALRSGLVVTTVNRYLTAGEAGYIVDDCGARALVTSAALAGVAAELPALAPRCDIRLMVDGRAPDFESYEEATARMPAAPLPDEPLGDFMLYSSGTTGRPKGITREPSDRRASEGLKLLGLISRMFSVDSETVYLSPAPLYHSAPLGFTTAVQGMGGTVVVMEHFDPEQALALIERYRVTHSQWVPTMFSRLLKLPEAVRRRYDLSSQRVVAHAAAPCPRTVKEAMFEWWGPIIHEYYGGTEPAGVTYCSPEEWLAHPGTVGRPVIGLPHICDDDGKELPVGGVGTIWFEQERAQFEYRGSPEATKASRHPVHDNWTTLNDVGYLAEDGFLYLTDRATFMIISGGVNIYPREIEDCLVAHPLVEDVAVFGIPDEDLGEQVKATVQLVAGAEPSRALEQDLIAWARDRISHYKCPKSIDFTAELPRLPTGKLYKRVLRDPYWAGRPIT